MLLNFYLFHIVIYHDLCIIVFTDCIKKNFQKEMKSQRGKKKRNEKRKRKTRSQKRRRKRKEKSILLPQVN